MMTLKAARVNNGLTQEEASKSLGVDVNTLRAWEKGKSFPNVPQIKKIETLYKVTFGELIFLPSTSV